MNKYRNKFEQKIGDSLKSKKAKFDYEATKIDYTVSGTYLVDFEMKTKTGKTIYIETKGNGRSFDHATRRKMIAVKQQHPELDVRIVFYSDGKIGPKRKDGTFMRQSDWAIKNGFKYAIKEIPDEWLVE
jgi:hypothetical protein